MLVPTVPYALTFLATLVAASKAVVGDFQEPSRPGGAGHALLFRDHVLVKKGLKDFPTTALTFEAWISTTDYCHSGAILSYAKDSKATDSNQRNADFNHFVIFDPKNILACHDYTYIDLIPDTDRESCHSGFGKNTTTSLVERDGTWHHLAVTWSAADNGRVQIYKDGQLMATSISGKTAPLDPNGVLMIGAEQDCCGGCTDPEQGFYGMMDEVRIWRTARSQEDILKTMRWASGLEGHKDLTAYWKFNDPDKDNGEFQLHKVASDSSGRGNDLELIINPAKAARKIKDKLSVSSLTFKQNFLVNKDTHNMPEGSFTVEFWAKASDLSTPTPRQVPDEIFSFASRSQDSSGSVSFLDDAIRVQRITKEQKDELSSGTSTLGAITLHVNSNAHTDDAYQRQSWISFDAKWVDAEWHHVAVSWDQTSGSATLLFDGQPTVPFMRFDSSGHLDRDPAEGGVDPNIAGGTKRSADGSLVLAQDQNCMGGCFSSSSGFNGELAVVRVWRALRSRDDVNKDMLRDRPSSTQDLAAMYLFSDDAVKTSSAGTMTVTDQSGNNNDLEALSNSPLFMYSTAPLSEPSGKAVVPPFPGAAGYALALNDKQVLMLPNFKDFPSTAITVEFWMYSVDACRPGAVFSYAAGNYENQDNAFLIFNYNSFGVAVMEDEGVLADHQSGVTATDGTWHHIAVTWESSSGTAVLYDNTRKVWTAHRSQGKSIPSGGTLVIGREQDCMGGCFDSAKGAAGDTEEVADQEYGPQDFTGVIEELRIWNVVRTPEEILAGAQADDGQGKGTFTAPGIDPHSPGLVAYYKFDAGHSYVIEDATGHGHDLMAMVEPKWEVVRWLSNCGNGVVEGLEECDDGNRRNGDGCSDTCRVEPGWACSGTRPSRCKNLPDIPPQVGPTPGATPQSAGGGSQDAGVPAAAGGAGGSRRGSNAAAVVVPLVVFVVLSVLLGVAYANRGALYEQFPWMERGVKQLRGSFRTLLPGSRHRHYDDLSLDPEEMDVSSAFIQPSPAARYETPGHPGMYMPMPVAPKDGGDRGNGRFTMA